MEANSEFQDERGSEAFDEEGIDKALLPSKETLYSPESSSRLTGTRVGVR